MLSDNLDKLDKGPEYRYSGPFPDMSIEMCGEVSPGGALTKIDPRSVRISRCAYGGACAEVEKAVEQVWGAMRVSCDHLDRTVRGACQICCYEWLGTAPSCAFSTCPLLKEAR